MPDSGALCDQTSLLDCWENEVYLQNFAPADGSRAAGVL
jgi:hypothetical protein